MTDGVVPSNEWRGYVLRRIMRRAMRHGRMLGLERPFLWEVTPAVVDILGEAYPEIVEARGRVADLVKQEEERFSETLALGMAKIREYIRENSRNVRVEGSPRSAALEASGAVDPGFSRVVDGQFLFTLYDTYGFPIDLAIEEFEARGWIVPDD